MRVRFGAIHGNRLLVLDLTLVPAATVVQNSGRMVKRPAKQPKPRIIFRSVDDLALHPATSLVPAAPLPATTASTSMMPLEVLGDRRIISGREQFEAARKARQSRVPTVVVSVPEDQVEMYVLSKALEAQYLTDDQRACLAVEYAARLSARMRKERAAKAAAARYGRSASRTTGAAKQDARAEACRQFHVPPKKFRQVRKLLAGYPTLYQGVLDGAKTLKQARDEAAQHQVLQEEKERSAAAPAASPPGLILGDARIVIPTLPDDHFSALITDPPYGVNFRQEWRGGAEILIAGDGGCQEAIELFRAVLVAADPKLRRQAFLVTFVPAKHEPEFRQVVTSLGWTIIAYPVWVKNTRMLFPHLNVASHHERMILAVRGGAKLRKPLSDVFRHGKTRASRHPCAKPVALLSELIRATTVGREWVLDPFAGSGATLVAAKQLDRAAVGVEIEPAWHADALRRLRLS